jgi:hypothetical protein
MQFLVLKIWLTLEVKNNIIYYADCREILPETLRKVVLKVSTLNIKDG